MYKTIIYRVTTLYNVSMAVNTWKQQQILNTFTAFELCTAASIVDSWVAVLELQLIE